jgi:hypothetical protein
MTEQDIVAYQPLNAPLTASDLSIHRHPINYSMHQKNPVDFVSFFDPKKPEIKFHIPKSKVSFISPDHFQEHIIRLFIRDSTPEKVEAAEIAWTRFLKAELGYTIDSTY